MKSITLQSQVACVKKAIDQICILGNFIVAVVFAYDHATRWLRPYVGYTKIEVTARLRPRN
jgi:hypothetical protein